MAEVKWIKLSSDVFENRKIRQIEALPDHDAIIVIWFKILCLAGNINDNGNLCFTSEIPYTDQMMATQFNRPLSTVQMALSVFQKFGMVEIVDDIIHVSNWEKYQNIEGLDKIREQTRLRTAKYRERKKLGMIQEESNACDVTCDVTVTQCNAIEEDIEEEKIKIRLDKNNNSSDAETVIEAWNKLVPLGIAGVSRIAKNSTRYRQLSTRLATYGIDSVLKAIENVKKSDFLLGRKTEFRITFDWFVKSNNFIKVLDDNYANVEPVKQKQKQDFGFEQRKYDYAELEGLLT